MSKPQTQTCLEPDIINAPFVGSLVLCHSQRFHVGCHSWIDAQLGPRHRDDKRSEAQRTSDYREARESQRRWSTPATKKRQKHG